MGRWAPDARGRLQQAALELFEERGYDSTTVAEIAGRATLTERTFFRHFADKREVLFAGATSLPELLLAGVREAPGDQAPIELVAAALETMTRVVFPADRHPFARRRQLIVENHPELRERELIKMSSLAATLAGALRERGVTEPAATLAAEAGITAFRVAFARWVAGSDDPPLDRLVGECLTELARVTDGRAPAS